MWTVILTQLLNTLVLLFMKLLQLGGQGKRRSCPPPCFLRQSLLLSLKFPCSAEQAGHQAPEVIHACLSSGIAGACQQLISMPGFLHELWEFKSAPASTMPTEPSLHSMSILFLTVKSYSSELIDRNKLLPLSQKLTYKLKDVQKLSQ